MDDKNKTFKIVVFDYDGCFTDGSLERPEINAKDTLAIKKLNSLGIKAVIITRSKKKISHDLILERMDEIIYCDKQDKVEAFHSLLEKYGFSQDEAAFIGDDEPDINLLKIVGFSAAPNDAVDKVKHNVNFVTKSCGGHGAVREFVERVLKLNSWRSKKIVAVVGVRKGSVRCPNKNIRDFGLNQSLLLKKLSVLNSVESVDKIILSTDCEKCMEEAKKFDKVVIDRRSAEMSDSSVSGAQLFEYFGSLISEDEALLYSPPVSPFLSQETIQYLINVWKFSHEMRPVATFSKMQDFVWADNPLNYELKNAPSSQDLPTWFIPTLGFCLIDKEEISSTKNVLGKNPIKFIVDEVEGIDIDDKFDFAVAKMLNENNVQSMDSLEEYLDKNPPQVLDCTIRDGGYRNNWEFDFEEVSKMFKAASDAGINWFEAGFRSTKLEGKGEWFYSSEESLKKLKDSYKGNTPSGLAVMLKVGEYSLDDIPENSLVDMFRILASHSDFSEEHNDTVVNTCAKIKSVGRKFSINIPYAHKISDDIRLMFSSIHDAGILPDIVCLADTFGSMNTENIVQNFSVIDNILRDVFGHESRKIRFGFHAHNNAGDALLKTLYAIEKIHRLDIVDSCMAGMGRGIGNTRTEELLIQINKRGGKFIPESILECVFELSDDDKARIVYLLSGEKGIHPNKAAEMIQSKLNFREIIDKS